MSDIARAFAETADRLFQGALTREVYAAAEQGAWPEDLWSAASAAGLTAALLPEEAGGAGASVADIGATVQVLGRRAVPLPLAEHVLAAGLAHAAGLPVSPVMTLAPKAHAGRWPRVPWGRQAALLTEVEQGGVRRLALVPPGAAQVEPGENLAREPRDTLALSGGGADVQTAPLPDLLAATTLKEIGAAIRAAQLAGGAQAAVEMSVAYAKERVQFGKPIGGFQAVQHMLAEAAGEAAAASRAADAAFAALGRTDAWIDVAAAKARAGEAAARCAAVAHQVHGALGFTEEHRLHLVTRRLWSWRTEFGGDAEWQARLGALAVRLGPDGFWAAVTAR